MGEHPNGIRKVAGSIPAASTTKTHREVLKGSQMPKQDGTTPPLDVLTSVLEFDREELVDLVAEMLALVEKHNLQLTVPGVPDWVGRAQERLLLEEEHRNAANSSRDAARWARLQRQKGLAS